MKFVPHLPIFSANGRWLPIFFAIREKIWKVTEEYEPSFREMGSSLFPRRALANLYLAETTASLAMDNIKSFMLQSTSNQEADVRIVCTVIPKYFDGEGKNPF